jgi:hypothetical protein
MPWTQTAAAFLESAHGSLLAQDPRWGEMASMPPGALDGPRDGRLAIDWALSPQHVLWLGVSPTNGAHVKIAWGFASGFARRDPVFREHCARLGALCRGQRVDIEGHKYVFCPDDRLSLETEERVDIEDLCTATTSRRVLSGMRTFFQAVTKTRDVLAEPAEAALRGEPVPVKVVRSTAPRERVMQPAQTDPPTADVSDELLVHEFQRRVLGRLAEPPLLFKSRKLGNECNLGIYEGKRAWVRWPRGKLHHFFMAVGRKHGLQVTVAWGYRSRTKRDPAFRRRFKAWSLQRAGDKRKLGPITYTFCLWDELNVATERLVAIRDLNSRWFVEPCVVSFRDFVRAAEEVVR